VQTISDATSIARYFKRSQSLGEFPVGNDTDAFTIAVAEVLKRKDPMLRVQSLDLSTDVIDVTAAVFRLEIEDRIRVIRTTPRGLGAIDQTAYIQKITVDGDNSGTPWKVQLGVSPV